MKKSIKWALLSTLLIAVLAIVVVAYILTRDKETTDSTTSEPETSATQNSLDNADWLLYTKDFQAGLDFSSPEGTLVVVNKTDESLGLPSLYTIDPETEDRLEIEISDTSALTEETEERSVTFPGTDGPTDSSYIGMALDGEDVGGFYTAELFASLPPYMLYPDNPQTVRPTSGIWDFTMTVTSEGLSGSKCPQGIETMTTSGQGTLNVTPDGLNAELFIDDEYVDFYRVAIHDTLYRSYERPFPTFDEEGNSITGTAYYTFNALDQELIEGQLHWDNTVGCTGTYPFDMELDIATEVPPYVPSQGLWTLTMDSFSCGNAVVPMGTLTNLPFGSGNLTVTGGGPMPMNLLFDSSNRVLLLTQTSNSNYYTSMPHIYLGTVVSSSVPPVFVNLSGTFHGWAQSENKIQGMLVVWGTNGCNMSVPFTMIL